ncbi:MAG: hypothetical protein CL583_03295 [Alteromonadaceae bacterium]|nr:hypothetical protein [Alteromonadaceae bacterium]
MTASPQAEHPVPTNDTEPRSHQRASGPPQHSEPSDWLEALKTQLRPARERRLVWVRGSEQSTRQWTRDALSVSAAAKTCWVGAGGLRPDQARAQLGQEHETLVWDARAGFHPDAFGALAGTLVGGGVLFLLTPLADEWPFYSDPDYGRMGSTPGKKSYLARLAHLLENDPHVLRITPGNTPPPLPILERAPDQSLPTRDQQRALTAILRVRRGHRRRPLVLTADRGRGKSAILGMAAAQLINEEPLHIVVTALQPKALDAFWRHAKIGLEDSSDGPINSSTDYPTTSPIGYADDDPAVRPDGPVKELLQSYAGSAARGSIHYLKPAELLDELPQADLLLVDEAAAIPVPILARLLNHYARIVFASTVHGYEGSGRGFKLRFERYLNTKTPQWHALSLTEPVRWAASDPLEPLLNRLLLLDADLPELPPALPNSAMAAANGVATSSEFQIVPWPRSCRVADESRLSSVFGLLVNAHYQTTPDDLRLLLDDPDSRCWLALKGDSVVGAIWLMAEGGLEPDLALAVRQGQRRTRGQLLPQALAAYGGDALGATLRYWRIVRVAVHPDTRRQGVGRQLVAATRAEAEREGLDVLGTSFGADPELFSFWLRSGLSPLRMGVRRDPASGAYSMMMGQGITEAGSELCQRQAERFAEHWPLLLTTELASLEPALVLTLGQYWTPAARWSEQDRLEVEDFANGHRPLALTLLPLQRLTWRLAPGTLAGALPATLGDARALWCSAILQQVPEGKWQSLGLASGRKGAMTCLRAVAGQLLAHA